MTDKAQFDIAIIGGGLAGSCMAAALLTALDTINCKIAIVEAQPAKNIEHNSFDSKAIALAYGSVKALAKWGIWSELKKVAYAIDKIEVSEAGSAGYSFIDLDQFHQALGYVVEAAQLGQVLTSFLQQSKYQDKLEYFCPDELQTLQQHQDRVELTLKSGQKLSANLLLACDGANSQVRTLVNIPVHEQIYQQSAVTTNVQVELNTKQNISHRAYERFTAHGPLAMLPIADDKFGLVWCGLQAQSQHLISCSEAEFIRYLHTQFGYKAGRIVKVGKRNMYPLKRLAMQQIYHHRVLFLANASHTVHPIAGQGFNLGIRDISAAADLITHAVQQQQDLWQVQNWQGYIANRNLDIQTILSATDILVRGFSNDYQPLKFARNAGLIGLELSPWIKRKFAQAAMGLGV
ncbi:2-octaprenyl-6-methoxyphenyl hydroxylase [Catenovulum sediminis]|uniref:2-octaprenyl-6-methoxyphenyl hydroxylase n=1 Tax=Catenovulum sediminis TaxID=1740262 RepID=UPI0011802C6E|nr:2-octaprenyl-6-methoxyphenyl hydroxylase [Catenovulum sediminis]